ncbi:hypothetical protein [Bacillus toyonensis]|uniref:hypothetical protein n=1 Tax=Bacillus toyonensis TaxID=155322 RepID=UPI001C0B7DDF|nr:hypothetical protein [Bacillus toyonensis]MBU4642306.1 hypothetical protein [Bacillus toyonensis]
MKSIYKSEKDLLIEQMWKIVLDATRENGKVIDDAGCDWLTVDNKIYIGSTEWLVSENIEVARLVNAINTLNGSNDLINNYNEVPIETATCKTKEERMIELVSGAHRARNKDHLDNFIISMLSVMVKGTPYQTDVEMAFDMRQKYDELERKGRSQLIMNLFEVGKKYEIETFIKRKNEYFKCKCYVDEKTMEDLWVTVFEPSNVGELLIEWTDVAAVKEIE